MPATVEPLRPELEPPPSFIAALPRARGYPVPFFVAWLPKCPQEYETVAPGVWEESGPGAGPDHCARCGGTRAEHPDVPEFRMADPDKLVRCVKERLCWVCGQRLGRYLTFTIGPMCAINRTSAEPPSHRDCARWSAKSCPFLSRPHVKRREDEFTEAAGVDPPGEMIRRNPGVTMLWTTRAYTLFAGDARGVLFDIGTPESVEWWAEGKPATRAQVEESIRTGLPILEAVARNEDGAMAELDRRKRAMQAFLPQT